MVAGHQTEIVLKSGGWPMVGRAAELKLITEAINSPSFCAGVVISGALGVGKSGLARAAAATCGRAVVHWTAGSSAAKTIPLGAFVNWLPADTYDALQATGQVIAKLVGDADPGLRVVVVDDAHLLDDTSAFMLQQLADRGLARLVLTVCTGATVSDAVAALWRRGRLKRVDVTPLGHTDCVELLAAVLEGPVDPVSERRLWHLTHGNVRFIRHIVEQELQAGRLHRNDGTWRWLPGAVCSSAVCDLVEHQMGELSEPVAEVIDLLSVAEELPPRMLTDLVGAGPMEEAEKRSLIVVDGTDEPAVRLAHPLYGEVRRMRAGHIRLRRLRGTVASALPPSADPRHVLRRAALLLESDVTTSACDMLRAAEAAIWWGDGELALRFAEAANSAGARRPASLACAEALTMTGQLGDAQAALADDTTGADAVVLTAVRAKVLFLQGRSTEALAELRTAQRGRHGSDAGVLEAMRAFVAACAGDLATASRAADVVLGCTGLPDFSTVLATAAKVVAMGELGIADDLESTMTPARVLGARSVSTSFLRFVLAEAHVFALQLLGFADAADGVVDGVREDDQPPEVYRWVSMMSGSASLAAGRVDEAARRLRAALSAHRATFLGGWLSRYNLDLAIALAIRGESDAANQCIRRYESTSQPGMAFLEPMEMLATAWISASMGAVSRAIAEARTAAVTSATRGQPAREVLCLQVATRFGDTTTVARLGELVHVVGGRRVSAAAAHAAALASGDGEGLIAASDRYVSMGDLLSAVDAAAQASLAFRHADRNGSALGATGRARELAERCGEVRTPALTDAAAPPVFTGREREVIMLAGRGLTNREIAERLQLSVRTVEGHLYRAAGRVGARDRKELARTIGDALAVSA
jgi:DNA-binding CsgD family transcriptional regulator